MSTPNVFIKVGTTMAKVHPDRYTLVKHQLERASKLPTLKQARAAALKGGVSRKYPKFTDGMTVAEYVRQHTMLNARTTGYGIRSGSFLSGADVLREQGWIAGFFEPLSTAPQYAQVDETIEEEIAA